MTSRRLIDHSENRHIAIDAAILVDAFEGTLSELGLTGRTDPAVLVVANHIITFAKAGERDPVRLRELTLEAIRIERRRSSAAAGLDTAEAWAAAAQRRRATEAAVLG